MNDEVEIEIIGGDEYRDIPLQAEVEMVRIPIQTMVVNGRQAVRYADAPALVCPACGEALKSFSPDIGILDVLKGISTGDESQLRGITHCPNCGRSVRIMRPLPIDVSV